MHQHLRTIITKASLSAGLLLAFTATVFAHGGFDHVIGTVSKVDPNMIMVTTAKGPVMVMLNEKTEITKDSKKALAADLTVGARVVVDIPEGSKDKVAHSVKIGVTAAPADHHDHDGDHDHDAHK